MVRRKTRQQMNEKATPGKTESFGTPRRPSIGGIPIRSLILTSTPTSRGTKPQMR